MVKQIFRLLHFHVRMYIYIYMYMDKQVSRRNDSIRGRSFVLSLEYIERQGGIFFFKTSQESKHLLVGCCTELVPVDVRVLLPHLHACACAHNKQSSTPGSVFFNQSGSASRTPVSSFSFSLRSLNRSCSFSSKEHFVKKCIYVARPFFFCDL